MKRENNYFSTGEKIHNIILVSRLRKRSRRNIPFERFVFPKGGIFTGFLEKNCETHHNRASSGENTF